MKKLSKKTEKAFKDACKKTGKPESIDLSSFPEGMRDKVMADYMLMVITESHNEGWVADYNNPNQKKWIPWFYFSPSGVRFNNSNDNNSNANAGHTARNCFSKKMKTLPLGKK